MPDCALTVSSIYCVSSIEPNAGSINLLTLGSEGINLQPTVCQQPAEHKIAVPPVHSITSQKFHRGNYKFDRGEGYPWLQPFFPRSYFQIRDRNRVFCAIHILKRPRPCRVRLRVEGVRKNVPGNPPRGSFAEVSQTYRRGGQVACVRCGGDRSKCEMFSLASARKARANEFGKGLQTLADCSAPANIALVAHQEYNSGAKPSSAARASSLSIFSVLQRLQNFQTGLGAASSHPAYQVESDITYHCRFTYSVPLWCVHCPPGCVVMRAYGYGEHSNKQSHKKTGVNEVNRSVCFSVNIVPSLFSENCLHRTLDKYLLGKCFSLRLFRWEEPQMTDRSFINPAYRIEKGWSSRIIGVIRYIYSLRASRREWLIFEFLGRGYEM